MNYRQAKKLVVTSFLHDSPFSYKFLAARKVLKRHGTTQNEILYWLRDIIPGVGRFPKNRMEGDE